MNYKGLGAVVFVVLVASLVAYQVGSARYQKELLSKKERISLLERSIEDAKAVLVPVQTEKPLKVQEVIEGEEINCLLCHELDPTKSFHVPQIIMQINMRDGARRRICVDCHGPLGPPWSAEEQLTPISQINYNPLVGENGLFEIPNAVTHSIHKMKLESRAIRCQTCHGTGTELIVPVADTSRGQVLVCQNCKFHPEEGNYITIHVELAGKKCTTCHTGGIIKVHQEKTKALGQA
jgi:hypothetical protein